MPEQNGMQEFEKAKKAALESKLNVMIVGTAGVGKSTLINALFGIDTAKVGVGRPVTTRITAFSKGNLKIYDTAGIELDEKKREQYLQDCINLINDQMKKGEDEQIHLLMYCLRPPKLQTTEEEYLKKLSNCFNNSQMMLPVILVNPRMYEADDEELQLFYNQEVIPRFQKLFPFNGDYTIHEVQAIESKKRGVVHPISGVEELVSALSNRAGESRRIALLRALRGSVDIKCEEAKKIANGYIALASGTAVGGTLTGIPDEVALLGLEIAMCAHMGTIFDFALDKNRTQAIVEASIKTVAVAYVARTAGLAIMAGVAIITAGAAIPVIATGKAVEAGGRAAISAVAVKSLSVTFISIMRRYALGELDDEAATQLLIEHLKKEHRK